MTWEWRQAGNAIGKGLDGVLEEQPTGNRKRTIQTAKMLYARGKAFQPVRRDIARW